MADVTIRRMGEMLRAVFETLKDETDGLAAKDVLARLEAKLPPTTFELGTYEKSGGRRYEKIVRFSTIGPVKAGWLAKTKGRWSLTEDGKVALETYKDPEGFYRAAHKLYKRWKASEKVEVAPAELDVESDAVQVSQTFEEAEERAWKEIEEHLQEMPPYDFQKLVAGLLRAMGYYVSWVAPPGRDGGIDILAWSDPLGTNPPRIKVQVKRQRAAADVGAVRSFVALLGDGDVGLFVSLGGFTKDAQETARGQERRQLTLIDLERLFDLWVEHSAKLKEQDRALLPLRPIYFLAPTD